MNTPFEGDLQGFSNILVVVDPQNHCVDNPALVRAQRLAKINGATLTVIDVVQTPGNTLVRLSAMMGGGFYQTLEEMLVRERQRELDDLVSRLDIDQEIRVHVAAGRDYLEIIKYMQQHSHDLLLKVANARQDGFDRRDLHLLRQCPQPVWLIRADEVLKFDRVMAAIDLSLEEDEQGRVLNARIMELAVSLAEREQCELHLLSCWSLQGEASLRNSVLVKMPADKVHELLEEEKRTYRDQLQNLAHRYQLAPQQLHLLKGSPVELIPQFVREHEVDVAVMGTVARSGIPGLLIGNTAETILGEIESSVLALKPAGFESPVS